MEQMPPNRNINFQADYGLFKQKEEDFNKLIQSMESQIVKFDLYLQNAELLTDEKGNEILSSRGTPRMNTTGREYVKERLRFFLSPNTYMSEPTDENIRDVYGVEIQNLQDELYPRMNEFECCEEDISAIYAILCSSFHFALLKAKRDKGAIYGSMSSSNTQPIQNNSGGILGMFRPPQQNGGY